jgi:pimeloyl-ACP methyl ester carboxylesterase
MQSLWLVFLLALSVACNRSEAPREREPARRPLAAAAAPAASAHEPSGPVVVTTLEIPGDQPVFALQGGRRDSGVVGVVLHGWCSHGMGVLQAFQFAAAEVGRFIALQGDHHCGAGPMRGWSGDVAALDARIDSALRSYLGGPAPAEIVVVGSSQGAERAVALARRYPDKYTRLILMSGPKPIEPGRLKGLKGAYFFVGQHEQRQPMAESARRFQAAGLRAKLQVIPGAGHADFHGAGDPLSREAFRFLGLPP